ncbi:MAG: ABC transporter permease [Muribaculaceae bacterium]|nr:ABC transporter permease [Muribaculaceae bacterium]
MFKQFSIILKKELAAFFNTNLAYVLMTAYILLSMSITFFLGGFFSINNADMFSFFYFQSFVFAVLTPAFTMRLWAEERKSGTIEFMLTQPVAVSTIVWAKFFAAWILCVIMLMLTIPLWIYMNIYFETDNLNILSGYFACILTAGMFCALGCMISSFSSSPVSSYILTLVLCGIFSFGNFGWLISKAGLPERIASRIQFSLNFDKHYYDIMSGQISPDNLLYFILLIAFALWLNTVSIDYKRD